MPRLERCALVVALALAVAGGGPFVAGAQVSLPDAVEAQPLSRDAFATGMLDGASGALPSDLWRASDARMLEFLLINLPARPAAPSLGAALARTLLSPGAGPDGAPPSLGGQKLLALARAGFLDEARNIESLSIPRRGDPWMEQAGAVRDLLDGDIGGACRRGDRLTSGRDWLFWVELRVLCYAETDEPDAADLTLGILRDRGELSGHDDAFLTALATRAESPLLPPVENALHYAIARKLGAALSAKTLAKADGGVLVAIARDPSLEAATRIAAGERAVAMGVLDPGVLAGLFQGVEFDVAEIADAERFARASENAALGDAALYQSVQAMSAPDYLRDKARRMALALGRADQFYRAYALSLVYAHDIAALEGAAITPDEAALFALARMAVGDSVGAAHWLGAMVGDNQSIGALPQAQSAKFVDHVSLLAVLDPQTAAQIARAGGVSLVGETLQTGVAPSGHAKASATARILEIAFDAALDGKAGQAGLAALAASAGDAPGGEIESVIVSQSLAVAGLSDLRRRYEFERAWGSRFVVEAPAPATEVGDPAQEDDRDWISPRLKPRGDR